MNGPEDAGKSPGGAMLWSMAPSSGVRPAAAEAASRYEVLTRIARGGMASVFVGRVRGAVGFSRLVAIKRPHPFVSDDPALRDSFVLEARVAAAIHHPHVVSVVDVELDGEGVSLILDYVEGCALSDLLSFAKRARSPLSTRVAVRIILDAASGLHAAHVLCDAAGRSLGIVHRDVSPQNILVGLDGHARLTDFGIAKITFEGDLHRHRLERAQGKARLHAARVRREQGLRRAQRRVRPRGRRLGGSHGWPHVLRSVRSRDAANGPGRGAPAPSSMRPELAPFDDIFARAIARDPRERFASVQAFASALEERARQRGWVAPHDEVAGAVEAAVGDRLRERRRTIESSTNGPSVPAAAEVSRPPRDAMVTLSLPGRSSDLSPVSQPAAFSRSAPLQAQPRRLLLAAAVAASLLGGTLGLLAMRCGASSHRDDVGTRSTPNAAAAPDPPSSASPPSPSDRGAGPPSVPSETPAAPVETVASTPADSLPATSASARPPSRHPLPKKPPAPARPPPRPNEVLFPNPG